MNTPLIIIWFGPDFIPIYLSIWGLQLVSYSKTETSVQQ